MQGPGRNLMNWQEVAEVQSVTETPGPASCTRTGDRNPRRALPPRWSRAAAGTHKGESSPAVSHAWLGQPPKSAPTQVRFRSSRLSPAGADRRREGARARAGRTHSAAAFPFSSQRKCFGRQIIPGDMRLRRRPPHLPASFPPPRVARRKNSNEHLCLGARNPMS